MQSPGTNQLPALPSDNGSPDHSEGTVPMAAPTHIMPIQLQRHHLKERPKQQLRNRGRQLGGEWVAARCRPCLLPTALSSVAMPLPPLLHHLPSANPPLHPPLTRLPSMIDITIHIGMPRPTAVARAAHTGTRMSVGRMINRIQKTEELRASQARLACHRGRGGVSVWFDEVKS